MPSALYPRFLRNGMFRALGSLAFLLAASPPAAGAPLITEFLAGNDSGITDEDGTRSDWIEIFNPGPGVEDLDGYYLTDDAALPTKWRFPAVSLNPNAFLLVFASDKNRAIAGAPLHANFKLAGPGEYLALIAPDGVTPVSEFAPAYPVQFDDHSYGLQQLGTTTSQTLVPEVTPARALVPPNGTLGTSWTANGFDDSAWTGGMMGVGYERSSGYDPLIGIDVEAAMYNLRTSVYIRIPFTLANAGEIAGLTLRVKNDDGFVAYLNGTRIADARAPASPAWNSGATADHTDSAAVVFETYNVGAFAGSLAEGTNVLAIHGLNNGTTSSDMLIRAELVGTRLSNPSLGGPGYFLVPTPGAVNGTEQGLPSSEVAISVPSRTFTSPFSVILGGALAGQTIRYTTDRSEPGPASTAYAGPIGISATTQIRARIFGANNAAGPTAAATYLYLEPDIRSFTSNLPIVIVEDFGAGRPDADTTAFLALIEPDPLAGNRSNINALPAIATRSRIKVRGSSSAGFPQYSLSVETQNETGEDQGIEPLGLPRESDWVLGGPYEFDRALFRNALIYRLSNEIGEYATRTRFVEVFMHTNGGNLSYANSYFGVYTLIEKIKRDRKRVDVASLAPTDSTEPAISGGYLFKKDRLDPGDSGFNVNSMGNFGHVEPKEDDITATQRNWLVAYLNEFDAALYNANWTHPTTGRHFTDYILTDSWLKHHWLNTLAMNVDGFRLSGYYYKDRNGALGAGPIWDFDRTMQSTDGRDDNPQQWDGTGDSSMTYGDSRFPWWGRALSNPDFRQEHTDLWQELRRGAFSTANIHAIIDEFAATLNEAQARHFAKWTGVPPRGGYAGEISIIRNWLAQRAAWIDSQYTAPPSFATAPGHVPANTPVGFTGGGGTIHFTTNGTDPRAPGGGISPSASTAAPVIVPASTVITARARNGTNWSGPITGTFLVGPLATAANLLLSEIHYAPLPPQTPAELAAATGANAFEFLELVNTSATDTIALTGVHFADGIDFTFTGSAITSLAPGERVLIVSSRDAFEARYGLVFSSRIAGEFANASRLDNAGERLHLVDGLGGTIADITYGDAAPWPFDPGFSGYSLVYVPPTGGNPALPENWRSSTLPGGNPNASDRLPLPANPGADNDLDGLAALAEHFLGTSDASGSDAHGAFGLATAPLVVNGIPETYYLFHFQRNLGADGVEATVESSGNFLQWDTSSLVFHAESNNGDGTSTVTYRSLLPAAAFPGRLFVRLALGLTP